MVKKKSEGQRLAAAIRHLIREQINDFPYAAEKAEEELADQLDKVYRVKKEKGE